MNKDIKIAFYGLIALGLLMLTSALYGWFHKPIMTSQKEYVTVPVEKVVTKIKTVKVPGPKEIVTIEKEKVVKALDLPAEIKNDEKKQVIADGEVPPYKGNTSVVTVMDTETGQATMVMKQKPLPFFSFENEKAIGAGYGISAKHGTFFEVHGRWTFVRAGSFYGQVYTEANTEPDFRALVQIEYRF